MAAAFLPWDRISSFCNFSRETNLCYAIRLLWI
jgi:hypothetical protein